VAVGLGLVPGSGVGQGEAGGRHLNHRVDGVEAEDGNEDPCEVVAQEDVEIEISVRNENEEQSIEQGCSKGADAADGAKVKESSWNLLQVPMAEHCKAAASRQVGPTWPRSVCGEEGVTRSPALLCWPLWRSAALCLCGFMLGSKLPVPFDRALNSGL